MADERVERLRSVVVPATQWLASLLPNGFELVIDDQLRLTCSKIDHPAFVAIDLTPIATRDEFLNEVEPDALKSMLSEVQDLIVEALTEVWPSRSPGTKELPVPKVERVTSASIRFGYADKAGWVMETAIESG
jgi:hypothetical protein